VIRVGVVVFPGSNCDRDVEQAVGLFPEARAVRLWHEDRDLLGVDALILPGGFSYGDYLRAGAIAKLSPIMASVRAYARDGGPVLGICNGFQILCEAGLLPGSLLANVSLRFLCAEVCLRCDRVETPFTRRYSVGQVVRMPIAHAQGNYFADEQTLDRLEGEGRVVFRYCDARGEVTAAANPNGSRRGIAGICNEMGNVVGMMPHPERCCEADLGGDAGWMLFASLCSGPGG
jgi:phosphoribosylformylglycinamidine synthase I